jgi:hypothetical protein
MPAPGIVGSGNIGAAVGRLAAAELRSALDEAERVRVADCAL